MGSHTHYALKDHLHFFQRDPHKYVADIETGDILQVNDVEWEILSRYGTQTRHQIVETLKHTYKLETIFDGIERLEQLGRHGTLLRPKVEKGHPCPADQKPKVLVPFHFTREKSTLAYMTNLNRYQFLTHLSGVTELETLAFSQGEKQDIPDFGSVQVRNVQGTDAGTLMMPWYAIDEYAGILLLSQFLMDDFLYYQVPDVPIVHCIEGAQQVRHALPKTLLTIGALQRSKDTLVVKASWMKAWIAEFGMPTENVRVIPDGIGVVAPIGDKTLAKQHTAALFEKSMFTTHPVVGLISGFEPNSGAAWLTAFARANPQFAIVCIDAMLAQHYRHPPENVVIFNPDDEETRAVLPTFFQALDVVCFPAMPGTPLSIVLEAMVSGAACVAMAKYGMPAEVAGHPCLETVKADWDPFGNHFYVPMAEVSNAIHRQLQETSQGGGVSENWTKRIVERYTWRGTARAFAKVFEEARHRETDDFQEGRPHFPPIFCRRYEPGTGTFSTCAYRLGINRYEGSLDLNTLASVLETARHTPTEVESVLKHFQRENSAPPLKTFPVNRK